MSIVIFIFLVPMMLGLYFVTLAIWELRVGTDRQRFIRLMFGGLVLIFIAPLMLGGSGLGFLQMLNGSN
ncbi:hypothetical protein AWM70_06130 [Paenibacillus yonginensis]|uniref:Uncharacterized protein n=1 Tax=Paenibacillus yonginensis TaxID=1462996 RepID=A0A1B1MYE9_9BACL|nr:hypothetical protein [Paenibacillus yonginensis]ANS74212.1 hypothetical protein AWM70_06130 [Paenibacillus yonginensis]